MLSQQPPVTPTKSKFFRSSMSVLFLGVAFVAGATFSLVYLLDRHDLPQTYAFGVISGIIFLLPINAYFVTSFLQKRHTERVEAAIKGLHDRALLSTPDGIFEWDIKNGTRYWSPSLKEIIGFREEEIDPMNVDPLGRIHPDDIPVRSKAVNEHLAGLTPELSTVFRWLHKEGHWVWVHVRGKAVFDDAGEPIFLAGTCMDITEIKEYEAALEEAKKIAENESRAKSDFLAHMSHEIRTPLTAITGCAEILFSRKDEFDPKVSKLLGALNASAQALRDLLGDILDFSKIESGQLKLEKRPFRVADVFQQINQIMSQRAGEKEIDFKSNYAALGDFTLIGDRIRFKQILINLIGNAIKFTEKGRVEVITHLNSHSGKIYFQVDVVDTGIGIRPENLNTIFDRFVQADSSVSRKYGGTGLGLPIARQLSLLMGGSLSAKSVFGEGSVFTVCVPVSGEQIPEGLPVQTETIKQLHNDVVLGKITDMASNRKIMIVEDYEGTITVLSQMIEEMGLRYDIARTGLEALNKWNIGSYGMILMDIQMPEMDGMTALTQIRNIEEERNLPRTPVIAMTAHAFLEDQSKCLEAGFDGYLAKPVTSDDLVNRINAALRTVAEKEQSI